MRGKSDADRLQQKLAADGPSPLPPAGPVDYYWNVNGDDMISQADLDLIVQHLAVKSSGTSSKPSPTDSSGEGGVTMSSLTPISLILEQPDDANETEGFIIRGHISPPGQYTLDGTVTAQYTPGFPVETDANGMFEVSSMFGDDGPSPGNGTASDVETLEMWVWLEEDPSVYATASTTVTIHNVAPELNIDFVNYNLGGPVWEIQGQVDEPCVAICSSDIQTLTVDWGDGSEPTVLTDFLAGEPFDPIPGHQYAPDGGVYTITVTVEDDDGGSPNPENKTFPMYVLDVDNDADNSGAITQADDPIEDLEPGKFMEVNTDDDNGHTGPDIDETGFVDPDLKEFKLAWQEANRPEINNYYGWELTLSFDRTSTGSARVWTSADKASLVPFTDEILELETFAKTWMIGEDTPLPSSLWLEAISSGTLKLRLDLWDPSFGRTDGDLVVFTALAAGTGEVDVDGDSDNNGAIDEFDDQIEEERPGYFIPLNDDDDNGINGKDLNEAPFLDDEGMPMDDLELRPALFQLIGPAAPGSTVTFSVGNNKIRLWSSLDKQPFSLSYGINDLPASFYIEGVDIGESTVVATLKDAAGKTVNVDFFRVFIGKVNLTAYRPKTEGPGYGTPFRRIAVPEAHEAPSTLYPDAGVGIRMNGDDDDGDGGNPVTTPDHLDTNGVTGENDLIEVEIAAAPKNLPNVAWVLKRSSTSINAYATEFHMGPLWPLGSSVLEVDVTGLVNGGNPKVWTEWASPIVYDTANLTLEMQDVRVPLTPRTVASDTLTFDPFASVVIVFGGNNTAPLAATDGAFTIAQRLYDGSNNLFAGYDVHAYNGRTADDNPNPSLREIIAAIDLRHVEQVAILGYSRGGGATFALANLLAAHAAANPGFSYMLDFTGYIDAIEHNGWDPEAFRPAASGYHVNYRQASGVRVIGPPCRPAPLNLGLLLQGAATPPGPAGEPSINVNVTATA